MKLISLMKPTVKIGFSLTMFLIILCVSVISYVGCNGGSSSGEPQVLARVEVPGYIEDLNLPVYAGIEDAAETYYALVIATKTRLDKAGVTYRVIDDYTAGTSYLIAREEDEGARQEAAGLVKVLYDDGEHIIVRYKFDLAELLAEIGFDVSLMSNNPIWSGKAKSGTMAKSNFPAADISFVKNPKVEAMLNAVTQGDVELYTEYLSGEKQVTVKGKQVSLDFRHTYKKDTKVQEAAQYVYDQLTAMGVTVDFSEWTYRYKDEDDPNSTPIDIKGRNVIGEIKGETKITPETPEEIVILIAHLDSISKKTDVAAPGADDNASGCVGLLTAAKIMSTMTKESPPKRVYKFKRTVRFVFTTGEEQTIIGGKAYAKIVDDARQKIFAVLNLDMIGYSEIKDPPVKPKHQIKIRHERFKTAYEKDLPVAQTYINVVNTYGMDQVFDAVLTPDGETCSDHAPFWEVCTAREEDSACYSAAWAIEYAEKTFINPKMHTTDDRIKLNNRYHMNLPYYTAVVKAAMGTVAHLAEIMD
jgi:hypothetical protein